MILIADGGSTKTSWALVYRGKPPVYFESEGYNPYYVDAAYISKSLKIAIPANLPTGEVNLVYYYGAGCFPEAEHILEAGVNGVFPNAQIKTHLDLLGAAHALLQSSPGFAAILGTGCNTCLYDGQNIVSNIDSLGFILGDEGSGAYMGKILLADYIREKMPKPVRDLFFKTYGMDKEAIFDKVYGQPLANRFCAQFAVFVHKYQKDSYFASLIENSFFDFFENLVSRYPDFQSYSFNCVGSIGFHFKEQLQLIAAKFGMRVGETLASPMQALVDYHERH
ncbi:MAG TPA: hypothetical protein VL053_06590 [Arachidicoccus sp.]|nr:hypothetical protein [Arachidicoccus sp.]